MAKEARLEEGSGPDGIPPEPKSLQPLSFQVIASGVIIAVAAAMISQFLLSRPWLDHDVTEEEPYFQGDLDSVLDIENAKKRIKQDLLRSEPIFRVASVLDESSWSFYEAAKDDVGKLEEVGLLRLSKGGLLEITSLYEEEVQAGNWRVDGLEIRMGPINGFIEWTGRLSEATVMTGEGRNQNGGKWIWTALRQPTRK